LNEILEEDVLFFNEVILLLKVFEFGLEHPFVSLNIYYKTNIY
jgi:hypothetical protein